MKGLSKKKIEPITFSSHSAEGVTFRLETGPPVDVFYTPISMGDKDLAQIFPKAVADRLRALSYDPADVDREILKIFTEQFFPDRIKEMLAVLECESRTIVGQPGSKRWTHPVNARQLNTKGAYKGSYDLGIGQINNFAHKDLIAALGFSEDDIQESLVANFVVQYFVAMKKQSNSPWVCASTDGKKPVNIPISEEGWDLIVALVGVEKSAAAEKISRPSGEYIISKPYPVNLSVNSNIGPRQNPMGGGKNKFHKGLDFSGPAGTPIYATTKTYLESLGRANDGRKDNNGNYVVTKRKLPNPKYILSERYLHLQESPTWAHPLNSWGDISGSKYKNW